MIRLSQRADLDQMRKDETTKNYWGTPEALSRYSPCCTAMLHRIEDGIQQCTLCGQVYYQSSSVANQTPDDPWFYQGPHPLISSPSKERLAEQTVVLTRYGSSWFNRKDEEGRSGFERWIPFWKDIKDTVTLKKPINFAKNLSLTGLLAIPILGVGGLAALPFGLSMARDELKKHDLLTSEKVEQARGSLKKAQDTKEKEHARRVLRRLIHDKGRIQKRLRSLDLAAKRQEKDSSFITTPDGRVVYVGDKEDSPERDSTLKQKRDDHPFYSPIPQGGAV